MPSLLRKVFLVDLLQGLKVTFRYQDPKEIYTEQYPLERPQVAERYRGAPRLNVNPDTDETMAVGGEVEKFEDNVVRMACWISAVSGRRPIQTSFAR